ncbi:radical SAM family heme chaperone HemW [Marinobacter sp. AL4B]|nr:radical SAM family heme chaperone HemW [Marinobacter sp. AL4B]
MSLYIHVPWCVRKCPYCDFNSHAVRGDIPEAAYLAALLEDLEHDLSFVRDRPIESVFIGGGTPSLMTSDFYQRLFEGLRQRLSFAPGAEVTLEANPGTLEEGRYQGFRQAGINRLSIGVQSFHQEHLKTLGRIHNADAAHRAIETAKAAGFSNFNVDLMHGLPEQTPEQALEDLKQALDHRPSHLSWYQLTIEPNTEFFSRPPDLPDDDRLWEIYRQGAEYLRAHNFDDYEVSAWSLPHRESRHNLNYWEFGDYLTIGAGGHGKVSLADGRILRYWKTRQPEAYLNRIGSRTAGSEEIEPKERPLEFMMNVLRLKHGVEEKLFTKRTGLPLSPVEVQLEQLRKQNLLVSHRIQTTEQGQRYLNSLLETFL